MTIRDMLEAGIVLEGSTRVRVFDFDIALFSGYDLLDYSDDFLDLKVGFIYPIADTVVIEVKSEE